MGETGYSVHQLAELSGMSVRALHHYDTIGLLVPQRATNGYRRYTSRDVERLQHIMLYRTCGLELAEIRDLLDDPAFDEVAALEEHLARLQTQRQRLDTTILSVQKALVAAQKGESMGDRERFEGLKQRAIDENERRYGAEARRRWGDAAVNAANQALSGMTEAAWNDMHALEERILELLRAAMAEGDTEGKTAQELVRAHARWLSLHWGPGAYSTQAHRGLADGYLADERFVAYYDQACGEGATQFLRDAIHAQL